MGCVHSTFKNDSGGNLSEIGLVFEWEAWQTGSLGKVKCAKKRVTSQVLSGSRTRIFTRVKFIL